jgi:hypothetical protein
MDNADKQRLETPDLVIVLVWCGVTSIIIGKGSTRMRE